MSLSFAPRSLSRHGRAALVAAVAVVACSLAAATSAAGAASPVRTTTLDMTFVSSTQGWLLTQPAGMKPALVEHTSNGGRTWHVISRSPFEGFYPCAKPCGTHPWAGNIRFANNKIGYIFGQSSAMTTDGGRTWTNLHREVVALETRGRSVAAVVRFTDASVNNNARLEHGRIGSRTWVKSRTPVFPDYEAELTRQAGSIWAWVACPLKPKQQPGCFHLLRSDDHGIHWAATTQPKVRYALSTYGLGSTAPQTLWLEYSLGEDNRLVTSGNGGRSWTARPIPGDITELVEPTAPNTGYALTGSYHQRNVLRRTTDSGRHWTTVLTTPGVTFGGTFTHSDSKHLHLLANHHVYNSTDGGRHWHAVPIA